MDVGKYLKVAEDIKKGSILSSTKAVLASLIALRDLVQEARSAEELVEYYSRVVKAFVDARPTSAVLINSLRDLTYALAISLAEGGLEEAKQRAIEEARRIAENIRKINREVAIIASRRIEDGDAIMTFSYSTVVLETLRIARDRGKEVTLYTPESRPGGEGFKMAEEAAKLGLKVVAFVDSAIRMFMKDVDKVIVGADAVAANGAVVNKVGTSMLALAAHESRVRMFVLAGTLKFSPETFFGELIELETTELKLLPEGKDLAGRVKTLAPLFDVTPPEYIDAIVTERGLVAPQAVIMVVREIYGWPPRITTLDFELEKLAKAVRAG